MRAITPKLLRENIDIPKVRISHNQDNRMVRITHNDYDVICEINQWLLDTFPHYLPNIAYGLPTGHSENGGSATCSWLEISCVDKEVI